MREDRSFKDIRKISFEIGINLHAEGSCLAKFGNTQVLCTASIVEKTPHWLKNSGKGWVTAEYGMLPRSTGSPARPRWDFPRYPICACGDSVYLWRPSRRDCALSCSLRRTRPKPPNRAFVLWFGVCRRRHRPVCGDPGVPGGRARSNRDRIPRSRVQRRHTRAVPRVARALMTECLGRPAIRPSEGMRNRSTQVRRP